MVAPRARASLADLSGAGIRLRPSEAVAIVRDIALQVGRGELPGMPSAHVIRVTSTGAVLVEGPVVTDGPDVVRAAHLLDSLLTGDGLGSTERVSGALRIVIARGLGAIDLPPYGSLAAFAEALARFAATDVTATVAELYARWSASMQAERIAGAEWNADSAHALAETEPASMAPPDRTSGSLTISDVRRARRETRLTLAEVSERSRIPAWMLRELEWGYFRNWPAGLDGRTQLVRYARAAGLDERLVVRTVWPALEEEALSRGSASVEPEDLDPADPEQVNAAAMLVPIVRASVVPIAQRQPARRRYRLAAAAAIIVLLGLALVPGAWSRWVDDARPEPAGTPRAQTEGAPGPTQPHWQEPPGFASVGAAMFADTVPQGVVPASHAGGMMLRITRVADDGARNYHARVSPDGTQIAFDSDRDGPRGVYVADADGAHVRRVSGTGFAAWPSWSPDGTALLFARAETRNAAVWNLFRLDLETGATTRLTAHESGQPWGGSWFPDGRRIAYARDASLIVLDTQTGQAREYPSPVRGRALQWPAVSPDGRHIMVHVLDAGGWLVNLAAGSMRRAIDDPTAEAFSWAPEGRRVAYHSGRAGEWKVWVKSGSL